MPSTAGDDVALPAVKRKTKFSVTFQRFLLFCWCRLFLSHLNIPGWLTGDIWMVLVGRVGWDLNLSRSSVETGVRKWLWVHPPCEEAKGEKWCFFCYL